MGESGKSKFSSSARQAGCNFYVILFISSQAGCIICLLMAWHQALKTNSPLR